MSDWIIIPKQHIKEIKNKTPKIAEFLQQLELEYDRYPGKKNIFFIIPGHFYEDMEILTPESSLDWNLDFLLKHHIEKIFPQMPQADQECLKERLYYELSSKIGVIMHENIRHAIERETKRDKPPVFNCGLSLEEEVILRSLFCEAESKAMDMGLNFFQLFLEGKLDRLMPGDSRLDDYNCLSDAKKKQLRRNLIETNGWETFYNADTEPSQTRQIKSKQINPPIMEKSTNIAAIQHPASLAAETIHVPPENPHSDDRWDNSPVENWTLDMLDHNEILKTVEEAIHLGRMENLGTHDIPELLGRLGLIKNDKIIRAAVVLFGKYDLFERDFPQCRLHVARFQGSDKSEILANEQFHGNIFTLLQHAKCFLRDNLLIADPNLQGFMERTDTPAYPFAALREALAKAFCNRDYRMEGGAVTIAIYANRLEITSGGTFQFGTTSQTPCPPCDTRVWNPAITSVLYSRGIIELWECSTQKIVEATAKAGMPRPEIQESANCASITFFPGCMQHPARHITNRQQQILSILAKNQTMSLGKIASALSEEKNTRLIREDLADLRKLKLVKNQGHGRGAVWRPN